MSRRLRITGLFVASILCLPIMAQADTQSTHRAHSKKKEPPPPLPSGTQGPVPQVPLDSLPAVAPQVTYTDGMLTIVAPNSTLGDILRSVRKQTSADIDVPATASERVVTRLGPAPAREVMAELLNGSRFNYILLGSPQDANALTRVVLVAKTGPDTTTGTAAQAQNNAPNNAEAPQPVAEAPESEAAEDNSDDNNADQNSADSEQQSDQPGVKTPQQLLQEMQQRQMQMQQQQQGAQPGTPQAPPGPFPHQPQPPQNQ